MCIEPGRVSKAALCTPAPQSTTAPCRPAALPITSRVWDRDALYNNPEDVAGSPLKSLAKLAYYHAFALLYGLVGAFAQVRQRGGSGAGAWGCGWLGATGVGERGEARQGRGQGCMIGRVM